MRVVPAGPSKPIFFKYFFNTIVLICSSDVVAPLVGWHPGEMPASSPLSLPLVTTQKIKIENWDVFFSWPVYQEGNLCVPPKKRNRVKKSPGKN